MQLLVSALGVIRLSCDFAALTDNGRSYEVNTGDGAFYGPKIDVVVSG